MYLSPPALFIVNLRKHPVNFVLTAIPVKDPFPSLLPFSHSVTEDVKGIVQLVPTDK